MKHILFIAYNLDMGKPGEGDKRGRAYYSFRCV